MHIVVFTGGSAPKPKDCLFYFKNSPVIDFVITADSGLDAFIEFSRVKKLELKKYPDVIVGDMDSVSSTKLVSRYHKFSDIEFYNTYKDFTDTELALYKAHSLICEKKGTDTQVVDLWGQDRITLVGGAGGRTDHLMGIVDSFSFPKRCNFWLTPEEQIVCIPKNCILYADNLTLRDNISFWRLGDSFNDDVEIQTQGLEWEWNIFRKRGMPSLSNRISQKCLDSGKPLEIKTFGQEFLGFFPLSARLSFSLN